MFLIACSLLSHVNCLFQSFVKCGWVGSAVGWLVLANQTLIAETYSVGSDCCTTENKAANVVHADCDGRDDSEAVLSK